IFAVADFLCMLLLPEESAELALVALDLPDELGEQFADEFVKTHLLARRQVTAEISPFGFFDRLDVTGIFG
ncbi:MAG TPA: hypothetical protein VHA37_02375, partial [Candidatus Saccharimonadales bacterium]|nr:hypothetical protein [Candidatus Saccharimonadales bacterium]